MRDFIVLIILNIFCQTVHGGPPLVINTWDYKVAASEAWSVLKKTGDPLDALVEGINQCEITQCRFTVGYGGCPDETGETTLDSMIMDGSNFNVGAVANLREIRYPIKVAKHVLLNTKHSLIAGNQATEFALKMGFVRESLTTNFSRQMHKDWLNNNCQPNFWTNVIPDPRRFCGPYTVADILNRSDYDSNQFHFGVENHDTIGMVVIDEKGSMFAGTSTNGAKHKIAGRVGDSPIPGSGAYCNNKYGAAVCTGNGDMMMRHLPSFLAVELMRNGLSAREAADEVMRRIIEDNPLEVRGAIIVVDKNGNYAVGCNFESGAFTVSVADARGVRLEKYPCV